VLNAIIKKLSSQIFRLKPEKLTREKKLNCQND